MISNILKRMQVDMFHIGIGHITKVFCFDLPYQYLRNQYLSTLNDSDEFCKICIGYVSASLRNNIRTNL